MGVCKTCFKEFHCAANAICWCMELPRVLGPVDIGCQCPGCISDQISRYFKANPDRAESFYHSKPVQGKVNEVLEEGKDYYYNTSGHWVFTAYYHLKKGYCCQNGCLHCPYGYKKSQNQ